MLGRSAARPRRQNSRRADAEKRCPPFLQWIRGRGSVRACHVDHGGDKGMGTKASDKFAIPMCDGAHEEQHRIGWAPFEARWKFHALDLAYTLWRHWLDTTPLGAKWKAREQ